MIVEIWRKSVGPNMPVKFTVGEAPSFISAEGNLVPIEQSPPVKSINFYAAGAFSTKAWRNECFVVQFSESPVRRIIPAEEVKDIAWEVPQKNSNDLPPLED